MPNIGTYIPLEEAADMQKQDRIARQKRGMKMPTRRAAATANGAYGMTKYPLTDEDFYTMERDETPNHLTLPILQELFGAPSRTASDARAVSRGSYQMPDDEQGFRNEEAPEGSDMGIINWFLGLSPEQQRAQVLSDVRAGDRIVDYAGVNELPQYKAILKSLMGGDPSPYSDTETWMLEQALADQLGSRSGFPTMMQDLMPPQGPGAREYGPWQIRQWRRGVDDLGPRQGMDKYSRWQNYIDSVRGMAD